MFCLINNICDNCTRCWKFTRSTSVEHCISKNISMNKNRIEHIIYIVKRMLFMQ